MKLKINNLTLDTKSYDVHRGKREIYLSPKEFELLRCLMDNKNIVLDRATLAAAMDSNLNGSNNVDVHISYLRKKIDKKGEDKLIHTIKKVGYKIQYKKKK
jgi:DNA-binding response OmpR family regulator